METCPFDLDAAASAWSVQVVEDSQDDSCPACSPVLQATATTRAVVPPECETLRRASPLQPASTSHASLASVEEPAASPMMHASTTEKVPESIVLATSKSAEPLSDEDTLAYPAPTANSPGHTSMQPEIQAPAMTRGVEITMPGEDYDSRASFYRAEA